MGKELRTLLQHNDCCAHMESAAPIHCPCIFLHVVLKYNYNVKLCRFPAEQEVLAHVREMQREILYHNPYLLSVG